MNFVQDLNDFEKITTVSGAKWEGGESMFRKDVPAGSVKLAMYGDVSRSLWFTCPCGCGMLHHIPIQKGASVQGGPWGWDGDEVTPTLTPSIRITIGCQWHGWLRQGVWSRA